jgi:hypothetical protein
MVQESRIAQQAVTLVIFMDCSDRIARKRAFFKVCVLNLPIWRNVAVVPKIAVMMSFRKDPLPKLSKTGKENQKFPTSAFLFQSAARLFKKGSRRILGR